MPNREALGEAQENLRQTQTAFDAARAKVEECERQLDAACQERDRLSSELDIAAAKLSEIWQASQSEQA